MGFVQMNTSVILLCIPSEIACMLLCTCRCEPATKQTNLCTFINSPTNYHIVASNESEAILDSFSVVLTNKSEECSQFIVFSLCFYLFRNCELHNASDPSSGLQLSVCKSKCSDISTVASGCFDISTIETVRKNSSNKAVQEFVAWSYLFNCSVPSTYTLPNVPISNTSCDNLTFIDRLLPSGGELFVT